MELINSKSRALPIIIGLALAFNTVQIQIHCADAAELSDGPAPHFLLPKSHLDPDELGIIVNRESPESAKIARYFSKARGVPEENIFKVALPTDKAVISKAEFLKTYNSLNKKLPDTIQALILTWTLPYRVDCMSITSAYALGFDKAYCASGCKATKPSPYFSSDSRRPFFDYGIRPAIMLAGRNFASIKNVIDRGVESDASYPKGTGYLVTTGDKTRNTRAYVYDALISQMDGAVGLKKIQADYIKDKKDVLFYFTGAVNVPKLASNRFLPGAIADHLTSKGGYLDGSDQMNSLNWLDAGATATYGTVVEPCNFPQKFPNPGVVISRYARGESLLEAYWKSVQMPGQGIFIGEPLANPFKGYTVAVSDDSVSILTRTLSPGRYVILGAKFPVGPYRKPVTTFGVTGHGIQRFTIPKTNDKYYRVLRINPPNTPVSG